MTEMSPEMKELQLKHAEHAAQQKEQVRRSAVLEKSAIDELAKATTANQGNRKQRRRLQAQFKKHLRSHL